MTDSGAGWRPDPTGRFEYRYHNGTTWTADVATGGHRYVDAAIPSADAARPGRNGMATAALTCGIVGALIGWLPVVFILGAILSVLGLVLGLVGLGRSRRPGVAQGVGRGFAITGIVTGLVGLPVAVLGGLFTVSSYRAVERYLDPAEHTVDLQPCEVVPIDDGTRRLQVAGSLRNDDTVDADFTVTIRIERAGSGVPIGSVDVALADVAPGETRPFELERPVRVEAVDCAIDDVTGPLPFGIDPG